MFSRLYFSVRKSCQRERCFFLVSILFGFPILIFEGKRDYTFCHVQIENTCLQPIEGREDRPGMSVDRETEE